MSIPKTKIPLIIVIVVVVILIGVVIIIGTPKKEGEEERTELEEAAIAQEIYGFTAEIKEIKDKTLTLEASIPLADATKTPIKMNVQAVINDTTKIVKLKFPKEAPKDSKEPIYPQETKISFNDLKVGDKIDIGTINNISGNIKNNTEFTLKHIFIIEK